ncbi:lipid II flippase MurJ, partial [Campylobacter jejuni]|uniref:lipid II flippase MurJ n=1 Tax=Campylobacter jejuni TaxID=197 RepID=UPI00255BAF17
LFLIVLVAFLGSILNYRQKFFIPSFFAALFILSIVIASFFVDKNAPQNTLYYFSYAAVLSGVAQLILHLLVLNNNPVIRVMT